MSRTMAGTAPESLRPGRLLRAALILSFGATLLLGTLGAQMAVGTDPGRPEIVDFHPFHIAGRLALEGRFADAYDMPRMRALQQAESGGRGGFMPFVYPPTFGLVLAPLALVPVAPAFLIFGAATLAFYLAVLRRLAGPWCALAVLVSAPAMVIDLRLGQNGLLTGGLAGLAASLSLRRRNAASGAAAGLLAFKPQVAAGLALALLLRRDGRALAAGAAVAAVATALAVAVFGVDALLAFRGAVTAMGGLMTLGTFPLHRLVSAYALGASLGLPPPAAMLLHAAVGVAVLGGLLATTRGRAGTPAAAGLCLMSTAFVSPYFFDYDLPVFCAGLALALPSLAAAMRPRSLGALLALAALAESIGIVVNLFPGARPSLGCPVLLACFAATATALRGSAAQGLTAAAPAAVPAS